MTNVGNDLGEAPTSSVLLPVYNGERYLTQAVESVLNQTFQKFELLLLNDGSTDGSLRIMESFAAKDSRCRVHSWPNRGLIATLNAGVELAKAEFIVRMDADDICLPDRFDKQIRYLADHPECVAVGSRVMFIDPEGMPLRVVGKYFEHHEIDAANLMGVGSFITHPAAIIRTDALKRSGVYRDAFTHAEDLDLFLRLAEVGQVANLPEVLLLYRQHVDSIGHRFPEQTRASSQKAVLDACQRRGLNSVEIQRKFIASPPPQSRSETHRKWGWWALLEGNIPTARKHALRALIYRPFCLENWRLAACVLRGH